VAQNDKDKAARNEQSAEKFGQSRMEAEAQRPAKADEGQARTAQNAAGQHFAITPEGHAQPIPNEDVPDPIDRLKTTTSFGNVEPGAGAQTAVLGPDAEPRRPAPSPAAPVDPRHPTPVGMPETKAEREAREAAEEAEAKAEKKTAIIRMMARGERPDDDFVAEMVEEKAQTTGAPRAETEKTLLVDKITEAAYLRRLLTASMMRDHPFLRVGADVMLRAEKQDIQISQNDDGSVTVALVALT
jgi:hypothetical protein